MSPKICQTISRLICTPGLQFLLPPTSTIFASLQTVIVNGSAESTGGEVESLETGKDAHADDYVDNCEDVFENMSNNQ